MSKPEKLSWACKTSPCPRCSRFPRHHHPNLLKWQTFPDFRKIHCLQSNSCDWVWHLALEAAHLGWPVLVDWDVVPAAGTRKCHRIGIIRKDLHLHCFPPRKPSKKKLTTNIYQRSNITKPSKQNTHTNQPVEKSLLPLSGLVAAFFSTAP